MSLSLFTEVLERSKSNNEVVSIRNYSDSDGFWAGVVKSYNENTVTIQHYTKYGKPDGFLIVTLSDIKSMDFDDDYAQAMQCIIDYSSELDKQPAIDIEVSDDEYWERDILNQAALNRNLVVNIELNGDDYYSGFVERVSEYDFLLSCIGRLGEDEGKSIFKIDDITSIRMNDIESRKRLMLYKWRQAKLA